MMFYRVLFSFCVFLFTSFVVSAQHKIIEGEGSCLSPYLITDTLVRISLQDITQKRFFLEFTCSGNPKFISVSDDNNQICQHLIFRFTGDNFCEALNAKTLMAERNKVCDINVTHDASENLSVENYNRGVCPCSRCCSSETFFTCVPNQKYIIVVYNPPPVFTVKFSQLALVHEMMVVNLGSKKSTGGNTFENIVDVEVGQQISMENIYFEGGTAQILWVSSDALNDLVAFMKKNPRVRIEIQGHVNGPNQPPDINYSNNLGYRRARAVYDYLVKNGVDKERLEYKGFGNTQMVYPNAVNEKEMIKNRRVEILILAK